MKLDRIRRGAALAALALWITAAAVQADWTWEESVLTTVKVDGVVKQIGQSKKGYSIKSNLARVDEYDQGGARIYNFQYQQAVFLNFQTKSFLQLGVSDLIREAISERARIKASLDQTAASAASMPPEQARQTLAQVEAQRIKYDLWEKGVYTIRPTSEEKEIAGHPCVKYEGRSNDEVFQEFWVARDLPFDPMFTRFFGSGMVNLDPQQNSSWVKLPGLPLVTTTRYGPVTVTAQIINPRTDPVPVSAFLIPEDFREAETKVTPGN